MKTNNKEFKNNVYGYILSCIDGENYGVELKTDIEKIDFVFNTFKNEYSYQIKYHGSNIREAFAQYLAGLPTCINIEFRNYEIIQLAKNWGSIPENANENQEDKIIFFWFRFIADNFFRLERKLNKK
jgi:hypothetical protein